MAYAQPWNETFPPDTQAANLLGDDIRDFKVAIRERVQSFAAGTLGTRPTPEAVWIGVMYFATDTGQVFRWNGATWDDITSDFFVSAGSAPFLADYVSHTNTGTSTEQTIYSKTLNGNTLGTTKGLRVTIDLFANVQGGTSTLLRLRLGGNIMFQLGVTTTGFKRIVAFIGNTASANAQNISVMYVDVGGAAQSAVVNAAGVDTTINQVLTITADSGVNGDSQTFNACVIEIL